MSREIPYEPMDRPKRVSFTRMQEILAKHAPRMKWRKKKDDDNLIESDAGYLVMRCIENGQALNRFIAFLLKGEERVVVGGYDTGDQARLACDAHRTRVGK